MYVAILGRQPAIGLAEIESKFGSDKVWPVLDDVAMIETGEFDVTRFGSVKKAGRVLGEFQKQDRQSDWKKIQGMLASAISDVDGKITIGLSGYGSGFRADDLQRVGLHLKTSLKKQGKSLRLVPNTSVELSTATAHHNKLGLSPNKIEVLVINTDKKVVVATSVGSQNITAYAMRDQNRPARDMFVGMLPPKLAQTIINMAVGEKDVRTVLDPFCGTGVVLQEACLMGYDAVGTDLAEKMVGYSKRNLGWLEEKTRRKFDYRIEMGDAIKYSWDGFDTVACETYLGQPFSAPPSPQKLAEVKQNCQYIVTGFLKNLARQTKPGARICIAVPAWRRSNGLFEKINIVDSARKLGYNLVEFKHADQSELLYHRDNQIVARELLVLVRS